MKILGHEFRPMAQGDFNAFAGADEGAMICYLAEVTLIASPDGSVTEIDAKGNEYWYERRVIPLQGEQEG